MFYSKNDPYGSRVMISQEICNIFILQIPIKYIKISVFENIFGSLNETCVEHQHFLSVEGV